MNAKQLKRAESEFWTKIDEFDSVCYASYIPIQNFFDTAVSLIFFIHIKFFSSVRKKKKKIQWYHLLKHPVLTLLPQHLPNLLMNSYFRMPQIIFRKIKDVEPQFIGYIYCY